MLQFSAAGAALVVDPRKILVCVDKVGFLRIQKRRTDVVRLQLGKIADRTFALREVFEVGEREFAAVVVPPNPMSILIPYLQTISNNSDCLLEVRSEPQPVVGRLPESFRFIDASSLAANAKHSLEHSIEIAAASHLNAMQQANFYVGISGKQPPDRRSFGGEFLKWRQN
jgi:hypothetical protein